MRDTPCVLSTCLAATNEYAGGRQCSKMRVMHPRNMVRFDAGASLVGEAEVVVCQELDHPIEGHNSPAHFVAQH